MTNNSVELVWSEVEGGDVVYQLYRFERTDALDPEIAELVTPIHEAIGELTWIDTSVVTGRFYTYVMQIIADDEVLERRWSTTLAVTDVTPPTRVTGVTATLQDGEILLEWSPSDDDVEFGSYGVYRTDLEGEPYIGGPGDRQQTSFIDDDVPSSGDVGYEIVAFDFHGNRSEPSAVSVDLG